MSRKVFSLLSKPLRRELSILGWKRPTKIQELALPEVLKGGNVLLIAPTGTGKTEAAVLPVFECFLRERPRREQSGISILYITPLRALNRDIFRRLIELGDHLGITVQVRHGDTNRYTRRLQSLKPPNMLITTPETLQAILPGKRMRVHLKSVKWVIVDEIHELATSKRGTQLSLGLERLGELSGCEFQRIGISATIGCPGSIGKFLSGKDRGCRILKSVELKELAVRVESPTASADDEEPARKYAISVGSVRRVRRLLELVERNKSTLIFTNTREHAEALSSRMLVMHPEVKIGVHHGSLSKSVRVSTERKLKDGELAAVVCTSSLELGIDVGYIDYVIQFMSPRRVSKFIQRIGRGGHIVGERSEGCIIAGWPDDILESAIISKFAKEGLLEVPRFHERALDVLAHQIAGLVLDWGKISLGKMFEIFRQAWPYRDISLHEILAVIEQLEKVGIIGLFQDSVNKRYLQTIRYYYNNLSTITDVKHYIVVDHIRRKKIGILDQEFIAKNGRPGQDFVLHGQTWKITNVDDEEGVVNVEPVHHSLGAIPAWEGEIIPVSYEVAQTVGRLRGEIRIKIGNGEDLFRFFKSYHLDREAASKAATMIQRQFDGGYPVPTDKLIIIEGFENYIVVHCCFGNLVNEVLGRAIATLLSSRLGVNIGTQVDPYRIALISPVIIDPYDVERELVRLKPEELKPVAEGFLSGTSLLAWRLFNVAKRFGLIETEADFTTGWGRVLAKVLHETPIYQETLREIYVEKMDLDKGIEVLEMIQKGDIEVRTVHGFREYSPLALPILDRIAPHDILRPAIPRGEIIEVVKERLNARDMRLVCVFNADYQGVRKVRSLPEIIRCPKCKSTLVAATYAGDKNLAPLLRKKARRHPISREELKTWRNAWKSANLVQTYGKKAVIVLAAKGVGPTNAVRILNNYHRTEDDLYLDIIRAERNYLRTRMFWDS